MLTSEKTHQRAILSGSPVACRGSKQAGRSAKLSWLQVDPLKPLRQQLDSIEIRDRQFAEFIYKTIPGQCPFERDITLFGRAIAHIPPLCKLNPLYDQLVGLRFRALCYLVDRCGLDIQVS